MMMMMITMVLILITIIIWSYMQSVFEIMHAKDRQNKLESELRNSYRNVNDILFSDRALVYPGTLDEL